MALLELCEPVFLQVCRVNRSVRKHAGVDAAQVRGEFVAIFAAMKAAAGADRALGMQYEKVRLPLVFFVDFLVRDSKAFGGGWRDLADDEQPPQLGGDQKFYDFLEEALKESDPGAAERLAVYYTCIGLGFTGWYEGQPQALRSKMVELSARIRALADLEEAAKVCPEAYENVNTANMVQPPGSKLVGIGIAMVGLVIVVFAANIVAYLDKQAELREALQSLTDTPAPPAEGAGS